MCCGKPPALRPRASYRPMDLLISICCVIMRTSSGLQVTVKLLFLLGLSWFIIHSTQIQFKLVLSTQNYYFFLYSLQQPKTHNSLEGTLFVPNRMKS